MIGGQRATASAERARAAAHYPLTITNCGTTTTYTRAPRRVISTFTTTSELLVKLGLAGRVVGTYYAPDPYPLPSDIAAAYRRLPSLGGTATYAPSKEAVLAARPDFVLSADEVIDFLTAYGEPSQAQLKAAGAHIYGLTGECSPRARVSDIYADILNIGRIFDVEPRAQALVDGMKARIAAVRRRVAGLPPTTVAAYNSGTGPIVVVGSGQYNDLLRLAGGHNVFGDQPTAYPAISREAVAAANPDVFVVVQYLGAMSPLGTAAHQRDFLFATFPHTNAARDKRSVAVLGDVWNAGYRTPEAVEQLARAFHPEAFK